MVWADRNPPPSTELFDPDLPPTLIPWADIVASHRQTKRCNTASKGSNAASSGGGGCGSGKDGGCGGASEWLVQWPRRKSAARMLEKALRAYESDTAEIADAARMAAAFETAAGLAR